MKLKENDMDWKDTTGYSQAKELAILNALLSPKWSTARACEIALAAVRKSPATALTSGQGK
jgi:hypothetical protein